MRRLLRYIAALAVITAGGYGISRGYYALTDGFSVANILPLEEVLVPIAARKPSVEERQLALKALRQPYTYLGKGCQSYVFVSLDGEYVLKFIKQHRFYTKPWLNMLTFIPWACHHRQERLSHKRQKKSLLLKGWLTAFGYFSTETGVLWVHTDMHTKEEPTVTLIDKVGFTYSVDLNSCEFLLQRRAQPLPQILEEIIAQKDWEQGRHLLDKLIAMVLKSYNAGIIDSDHALLQNTGMREGEPIQIDVGQFAYDPVVACDSSTWRQGLFNKTFRLRLWLKEREPALHQYLEARLHEILGEDFYTMKPHFSV